MRLIVARNLPDPSTGTRGARRRLALLLALALVVPAASAQPPRRDPFLGIPVGGGPIEVGPVPAGLDAVDAASCGGCHEEHYREWRASAHRISWTSALFQDEFGHRRLPSCERCHAPRPNREDGVDCAACHVRGGAVINPTVSGRAPHRSRVVAAVGQTSACARCHEFDFDRQPGEALQRTVSEWRTSVHSNDPCQTCHVPEREGRHAHHFPGGLDGAMVRGAVEVVSTEAYEVDGVIRVSLTLASRGVGHAVPTGDIFRRLEVRAWPVGRGERIERITLARRFRVGRNGWHEVEDERVPAVGTRRVSLELEGPADAVSYEIDLWRTPPGRAGQLGLPLEDLHRRITSGRITVAR